MLSYLKIGGGLIGLVALLSVAWLARDRFAQKEIADNARDCAAVAFKLTGDLDHCMPEVKSAIEARRQAEACDTALTAEGKLPSTGLYGIRTACSSEVKQLHAERDAARNDAANAKRAMEALRAKMDAAVERAEIRGANVQKRKSDATRAIQAAPVGDDGLVDCDADCLRNIGG